MWLSLYGLKCTRYNVSLYRRICNRYNGSINVQPLLQPRENFYNRTVSNAHLKMCVSLCRINCIDTICVSMSRLYFPIQFAYYCPVPIVADTMCVSLYRHFCTIYELCIFKEFLLNSTQFIDHCAVTIAPDTNYHCTIHIAHDTRCIFLWRIYYIR